MGRDEHAGTLPDPVVFFFFFTPLPPFPFFVSRPPWSSLPLL